MKRINDTLHCFTDPSLKHIDFKIAVWLISTIMVGLILSTVLPDFGTSDDKYLRSRSRTTQRMQLRVIRSARTVRRKAA